MDIDEARQFLKANHHAVLATFRPDASLHLSLVLAGVDDEGRAIISSTEDRVKVRNLRRDPRASLCAMPDRFFGGGVQVHGTATVVSLPEAMDPWSTTSAARPGASTRTGRSTAGPWNGSDEC